PPHDPRPLLPASVPTTPSRIPHPPAHSPAPAPPPTPDGTHSLHLPVASGLAPESVAPERYQAKSVLPLSRSRPLAHPTARTAPSAPPHPPVTSGKTLHAPRCSHPAAPALPGSEMAAAPAACHSPPINALALPPASRPTSCDPRLDDGATSSAANSPALHLLRCTLAATAPAVHQSGNAADQIAYTTAPLHLPLPGPKQPLPPAGEPSATPPAPAPATLPTPLLSAICRAGQSPPAAPLDNSPAAPACQNS